SREAPPVRRLDPNLPRDLETICSKCLQKEPARRYKSAAELADDLERFLEGRPIQARPVGLAERTWKWARRRRVVAVLLASLVLASVLGFAGVTAALIYALEGWRQAREQRDFANKQTAAAQEARVAAEKARVREEEQRKAAEKAQAAAEELRQF